TCLSLPPKRVEPQARAVRRDGGGHRGRELVSLVFTQTRVTRRIAMQRQSRSLPQPSTGLAVPRRWRPSSRPLCCRFVLSWLMTSVSDAISNGGSQGDAHGRKRALI